jgi:hypothetical protein
MTLRTKLNELAHQFADEVLEAVRSASLEELLGESGTPRNSVRALAQSRAMAKPARSSTRLARRSPEDIKQTLDQVHVLLKGKKAGLRSEDIRKALKLDVREMPRVLKEGLTAKRLTSKGQKRATTYFAR